MNAKDIPILKQKVLDMLPITQSDVCKNLDIDHRDGSKLVSIMIGESLIKRTKSDRTFLLERPNGDGKEESEITNPEEENTKKEKSEKEKTKKEKSEKIKPENEKSEKEKSDKEKPEKEKSDKEKPENEKSDKEKESDKTGDIKKKIKYDSVIKQKVLDMLPAVQSDVWKNLGIDRRGGSRLISKMVKEGLIKRTKSDSTFLLEKLNGTGKGAKDDKSKYTPLLSKEGKFSPCCGCERVCNPTVCTLLTEWLL